MTDLGPGRDQPSPPLLPSRPDLDRAELRSALAECGFSDHYAPGYSQLRSLALWALRADADTIAEANGEADLILYTLQHAIGTADEAIEAYGDDAARKALWGRDPDGPFLEVADALADFIVEWVEQDIAGEASVLTAIAAAEWAIWSFGLGPVSLFKPETPLRGAVSTWAWATTRPDRDHDARYRLRQAVLGRMRKDGIAVDPAAGAGDATSR